MTGALPYYWRGQRKPNMQGQVTAEITERSAPAHTHCGKQNVERYVRMPPACAACVNRAATELKKNMRLFSDHRARRQRVQRVAGFQAHSLTVNYLREEKPEEARPAPLWRAISDHNRWKPANMLINCAVKTEQQWPAKHSGD